MHSLPVFSHARQVVLTPLLTHLTLLRRQREHAMEDLIRGPSERRAAPAPPPGEEARWTASSSGSDGSAGSQAALRGCSDVGDWIVVASALRWPAAEDNWLGLSAADVLSAGAKELTEDSEEEILAAGRPQARRLRSLSADACRSRGSGVEGEGRRSRQVVRLRCGELRRARDSFRCSVAGKMLKPSEAGDLVSEWGSVGKHVEEGQPLTVTRRVPR